MQQRCHVTQGLADLDGLAIPVLNIVGHVEYILATAHRSDPSKACAYLDLVEMLTRMLSAFLRQSLQ